MLATFDDLRRCDDILTDGTAEIGMCFDVYGVFFFRGKQKCLVDFHEICLFFVRVYTEFRRFLEVQDQWRLKCMTSTQEAERLQRELDKAIQTMADLETKLFHARRLLEMENKARREAENDRDSNVSLFWNVWLLFSYVNRFFASFYMIFTRFELFA